jgi:hypothetical protein
MIGSSVTTLEFSVFPSLGLAQTTDTRRVMIRETHSMRIIELPIQAIEEFVTWWTNHGPIPTEARHPSKTTLT